MAMKFVIKRDGCKQVYSRAKMEARLFRLINSDQRCYINMQRILQDVEATLVDINHTSMLESIMAEATAKLAILHPEYDTVAGQIEMECIRKATPGKFSESCRRLASHPNPVLTERFMGDLARNLEYFDIMVEGACVPAYSYANLQYMQSNLLLRKNGAIVERPEYCFMRVSIALHGDDSERVMKTFEDFLHQYYVLSPAAMAHAGTFNKNMNNSYSVHLGPSTCSTAVFSSLQQTASITAAGGSVGVYFNNIASTGANVGGVPSIGVPPLLNLYDAAASVTATDIYRTRTQITAYLQPWHADILSVLHMIQAPGPTNRLQYSLSIPDLFMVRVHHNLSWSLFSPSDVPLLESSHGLAFDAAYYAYETNKSIIKHSIPARQLFSAIIQSQIDKQSPMMIFKDSINSRSNQSNMGMISHGNASGTTIQYSSLAETSTATSATLILPSFVEFTTFEYDELHQVAYDLTTNLNHIISRSQPASAEAVNGCRSQQAIAIGIQGLAEVFIHMKLPYASEEAKELYAQIMDAIYHGSASSSVDFARAKGCYAHFGGSALSRGMFNQDQMAHPPENSRYNWNRLKQEAATHGTANSVFVAIMPPDEVCKIAGLTTTFGPVESMIQTHEGFGGSYKTIYPPLVDYLESINTWDDNIHQQILEGGGSIQHIRQIPRGACALFRNSWELGADAIIDMAASGAPYICQGQPLDICIENPTVSKLVDFHFKTWTEGLKTGLHTLKTRIVAAPPTIRRPDLSPMQSTFSPQAQVALRTIAPEVNHMADDDSESSSDSDMETPLPPLHFIAVTPQSPGLNGDASDYDTDNASDDIYVSDNDEEAHDDKAEGTDASDDEIDSSSDNSTPDLTMFDPADFINVELADEEGMVDFESPVNPVIGAIFRDLDQ